MWNTSCGLIVLISTTTFTITFQFCYTKTFFWNFCSVKNFIKHLLHLYVYLFINAPFQIPKVLQTFRVFIKGLIVLFNKMSSASRRNVFGIVFVLIQTYRNKDICNSPTFKTWVTLSPSKPASQQLKETSISKIFYAVKYILNDFFLYFFWWVIVFRCQDVWNYVFCDKCTKITVSGCIFQSMKTRVELNSIFLKFFCFVTWFDERRKLVCWGHASEAYFSYPIVSLKQ